MAERSGRKRGNFRWVLAALVLTSPVAFLFIEVGEPGTGRAAWICLGMLVIAVKVRWELRRKSWFWATVTLIAIIETPLIILVPWTSKWIPAVVILPFGLADGVAILWLIQTVENWMTPSSDIHHPGAH